MAACTAYITNEQGRLLKIAAGIPLPDRIYLSILFCAPCYLLIVMVYDIWYVYITLIIELM
jgi:hypothetical protein